ncbi:hypothetical protein [Paraburkholderia dioscoreae]|uniref:Uncharacterized protein n=1 Tax=Paraburkholderia dioscoreae TaxID=2604047 RepID=A0A5Q4YTG2_9BURK|nr:hypothetical protein [Paraburkholderia dioscoreae]VVD29131.1 protein of unknown function [Paraburkholderia dioscoreae]
MTEASTISLRERFDSLNGGISMWLSRFSDSLVEHGLDEFYRVAHEESKHAPEMAMRNDWHFLRTGIEGLGNEQLESVIASLKEPFARIGTLGEEYQRCAVSIEKSEEQWHVVAKRARQQLAVWEPWAIEAEIAWRKRSFPWTHVSGFDGLLRLQVSIDLRGASAEIESPQRLQRNLAFFETQFRAVRATISSAYLDEELPEESSVYDFDMGISDLMKQQTQVNELVNRKAEIAEELKCARDAYRAQKGPLNILLGQLPNTAQWALFRICRPDLREPSEVKQLGAH